MVRSTNKYADKAKQPETKMAGERVKVGSAECEFYRSKLRFYQFLEDRITDPIVTNPLDLIDWKTFGQKFMPCLKNGVW